jgi:hypothetical protein
MHPFLLVVVGGFLVVGTVWWRHQVKLMQHQGVSREDFVRHFRGAEIADVVSGMVYDHFKQMSGVKDYQPAPTDSFEGTFKMSGEDLDDELEDLLPKLALDMPHSGVLREWNGPLETLSDVVRWVDWVRTKQNPSVTAQ